MRKTCALLAGVALLLLAGCGNEVAQAEVEETTADSLQELAGERPTVTCPGALEAEVGTEMECTATLESEPGERPVYLTVTDVEGDTASFDIEVGEATE